MTKSHPLIIRKAAMPEISFKERVRVAIIRSAAEYKRNFVDCEYLVCSEAYTNHKYFIIDGKAENFKHLTGVNSMLDPIAFFKKCCDGSLSDSDFDFIKIGETEKDTKGTVRRKISVLSNMVDFFNSKQIITEEDFVKNRITCSFATTDGLCTVGFMNTSKARPKTLLKGNALNIQKSKPICLLFRKTQGNSRFNELLIGDAKSFACYYKYIQDLVDEELARDLKAD
jgi:hypothetical protein